MEGNKWEDGTTGAGRRNHRHGALTLADQPWSVDDHRSAADDPALFYIPRTLEPVLRQAVRDFATVVLTGPRQSGKTTLLTRLLGRFISYLNQSL